MISLKEIYDLYILAKKFLGLSIEECRRMPFCVLWASVNEEIARLKRSIEEETKERIEERPVEEEIPSETLRYIEERIKKNKKE